MVRCSPEGEQVEDGVNQFLQVREVFVVGAKPARQLPDPFNGVELWAVGRQKSKAKHMLMVSQPRRERFCMVPPCIVEDNDHFPTPSLMAQKLLQEGEKRVGTKFLSSHGDESAVGHADRPEDCNTLSGRGMEYDRVHIFRWHPHGTPGTMLLKMTFVFGPQIKIVPSGEAASFFYISAAPQGPTSQSAGAAFVDEILSGGRASGIDARRDPPRSARLGDD